MSKLPEPLQVTVDRSSLPDGAVMAWSSENDEGWQDGYGQGLSVGIADGERRILALALYMEEQGLQLTAGRLTGAAQLVLEHGPLSVEREGDTMRVTQQVTLRRGMPSQK